MELLALRDKSVDMRLRGLEMATNAALIDRWYIDPRMDRMDSNFLRPALLRVNMTIVQVDSMPYR